MVNKEYFGPRELKGFTAPVNDVEFSPNDRLIAAASNDGTVRMWDMDPDNIFDLPTVFDDHGGEEGGSSKWVFDLDFNPEGTGIITAAGDGLLRYFPTKPDEYVTQICGFLNRNMSDVEWRQFVGKDIDWVSTCEGLEKPSEEE